MPKFYVMAEKGSHPPKHIHLTIDQAILEARRLRAKLNCKVEILKVVGEIVTKEVPVTKLETVEWIDGNEKNDLPF